MLNIKIYLLADAILIAQQKRKHLTAQAVWSRLLCHGQVTQTFISNRKVNIPTILRTRNNSVFQRTT